MSGKDKMDDKTAATVAMETENLDHAEGTSKVKFVFGMLKKLVGVKDLSSMRLSLPASLMEPESNLEFWNYMDRPDYFVTIPDGEDPLERMLRVIRWWYSKDTKWKDQRIRKPYNSILGERFLCWWDVPLNDVSPSAEPRSSTSTDQTNTDQESEKTLVDDTPLKVTCITEQISHHPPVSAYYYECKEKGIIGRGVDHISARFTGTNIKVGPGAQNHGIYITLTSLDDEEYNIQHPWASVTGWLSGSPYVVVGESAIITCPKTGLKAVLEYKEESMFGKAKFAIEGKIFKYDYEADKSYTDKERKEKEKLSKIKDKDVVCRLYGQWNGQIFCVKTTQDSDAKPRLLFDMHTSTPAKKQTLPLEDQHPLESRRIWEPVTSALLAKDFTLATNEKRRIEDAQRKLAAERAARDEDFVSEYFEFKGDRAGRPGPPVDMNRAKPFLKEGKQFVCK
ncbi:uncharacterized protein SPPG_07694 [Spizellomyces punctatus DAOM BR117]|uniref:Oxysterol-binding protein n=1 Tax=Spizellomyces punctatus (strain DAOM BR117) TaxID=645134 RepID=A0A0L0H6K1_SPIPD|nr:uncharacterized protein SPPG_07694 [Spizellomyces punctatus DAOM BR117]KNC96862.1 hypothetical protein SPPG_07694 [Spizellomyces punctatus DAOM BR117]|eukprot:XP_016604902.1 hypothetical protein SPPG_07694 [Spizellomyces punctatus DAOM BR117]